MRHPAIIFATALFVRKLHYSPISAVVVSPSGKRPWSFTAAGVPARCYMHRLDVSYVSNAADNWTIEFRVLCQPRFDSKIVSSLARRQISPFSFSLSDYAPAASVYYSAYCQKFSHYSRIV